MESTTSSTSSSSSGSSSTATADRKVLADLEILLERMRRCEEMLYHVPAASLDGSNQNNKVLRTTVSTTSTPNLLGVVGFLEACAPRMVELVEVAAQGAVSDMVLMKCLDINDKLIKLLSDIDSVTFVEDDIDSTTTEPDIAVSVPPAIGTTKSEDEFDAFLNDRVSTSSNSTSTTNDLL